MTELQKLPLVSLAEVQASSEAEGHPILLAFDDGTGPGGTYWKAGDPGEQTITVTFREPFTLVQVTMEVEQREGCTHSGSAALLVGGWRTDVSRTRSSGIQF